MNPDPRLRQKTIALVGLMGVGKSSIGRRLALALDLPFRDADTEVEAAAGRTISDIFSTYGEQAFREGERKVIARLLDQPRIVLATGGGAFMNAETRARIQERGHSIWIVMCVLSRQWRRGSSRMCTRMNCTVRCPAICPA